MNILYIIFAILSGAFWGSSGIFVRTLGDAGFNSVSIVCLKMVFAVAILCLILLIRGKKFFYVRLKDFWLPVVCGIAGMLGLNLCYNIAINYLTMSLAAVLLSTMPVFVIIISAVVFKERVGVMKVVCIVMMIAGCVLVSGIFEESASVTFFGVIMGLGSAVTYAIYNIFSKIALDRKGYDTFTLLFWSFLLIFVVTAPFCNWNLTAEYISAEGLKAVTILVLHSVLTAMLPYILLTIALSKGDTGIVSIIASGAEPASAALFGLVYYGEAISLLKGLGLVVVVAALCFICGKGKE